MNRPITAFTRMTDQHGRQLTWRGRWIPLWSTILPLTVRPEDVTYPVTFPYRYYKVDL